MVEELHAEYGDDPADDLDHDDAYHDRQPAAIDGGEHLPPDDGINCTVAELGYVSNV